MSEAFVALFQVPQNDHCLLFLSAALFRKCLHSDAVQRGRSAGTCSLGSFLRLLRRYARELPGRTRHPWTPPSFPGVALPPKSRVSEPSEQVPERHHGLWKQLCNDPEGKGVCTITWRGLHEAAGRLPGEPSLGFAGRWHPTGLPPFPSALFCLWAFAYLVSTQTAFTSLLSTDWFLLFILKNLSLCPSPRDPSDGSGASSTGSPDSSFLGCAALVVNASPATRLRPPS